MPDRSTPVEKLLAAYAQGQHDLHNWNLAGAHLSPGTVVREEWLPEPAMPIGEEGQPLATWAETPMPTEWPVEDERQREETRWQEDEEWLPEGAETEDADVQAAVAEWTAGMVRPQLEAEAREWEEEPIEAVAQPPLKEPEEAEAEAKYGI